MKRWTLRAVVCLLAAVAQAAVVAQAGKVLIGYCVGLKGLETAKAAGFDYVELGVTEIAALSDADFDAAVAHVKKVGLPTPNANLFLPATLKLTGPDAAPPAEQMAYVTKAFARLNRLGVRILCFGSGGARRVPDGFSKDEAFAQLVAFGKRIAPEARANGITVVIEPLRRQETNIINTTAEGLALVKAVADPNFQLLIDFFHLASEKEDPAIIIEARDNIRHLHMANPQGRVFPQQWEEYNYAPFFESLRRIGYTGGISIEASSKDVPGEAPRAIALLRRAFASVPSGKVQPAVQATPPQQPAPDAQKKNAQVDPAALPVDLDRIQKALANTPRLRFDENKRPDFRVQVFGETPTIDDILGPDWAKGPVPHGTMTHQEFLSLVTPKDVQGYAAFSNEQGATVAATSFLLQWTLQKAIRKYNETRDERARNAARQEVLDALKALEDARAKAGLPRK
jgi:sugar phosphate isomerase/epimerase